MTNNASLPPPDPKTVTARTAAFASVFDRLIESNMRLTTSVSQLIKLSWGLIALNVVFDLVLVAVIVTTVRRH